MSVSERLREVDVRVEVNTIQTSRARNRVHLISVLSNVVADAPPEFQIAPPEAKIWIKHRI